MNADHEKAARFAEFCRARGMKALGTGRRRTGICLFPALCFRFEFAHGWRYFATNGGDAIQLDVVENTLKLLREFEAQA